MDYRHRDLNRDDHSELYQTLRQLPKVELHRHLEGALRLSTIADVAREHGLDLPGYEVEMFRHLVQMVPTDEASADTFIAKFQPLRSVYRSPEVIDRIAYEVVADAAADNVAYMELRFTPIALARAMDFPLKDVTDWVIAAVQRAQADLNIDVRLIVSMNRHEEVALGEAMADLAIANMHRGVVGLDLAGAENRFPGAPFAHVFRKAHEAGLSVTIHAGEWAGPESIREAVEVLGAARLGHGVRVIESPDMVKLVRERGIALEVCPTSNLQSGVVDSLEHHPLRDLYHMGLITTLNTDDPSICGISLTDEYLTAARHLGFTLADLKRHVLNAAEVAFLPPHERAALVSRLQAAWQIG